FADFLIELGEQENLKGWLLLPSNDHAVYTLSRNKDRLENIYKVITPAESVILNILSKQKLLEAAKVAGVSYPLSWFPHSINDEVPKSIRFPVLVKGKFGLTFYKTTGKKAFVINDTEALKSKIYLLSQKFNVSDLFVQELIPLTGKNKTLSLCAFCERGEVKAYWMGNKLRQHPVEFGTATFAESVFVPEVKKPALSLLKELNYTGPCEVEFLLDLRDNKYKLIEINARTWLWVGLARSTGIDFARMVFDYANNIDFKYPEKYDLNTKWSNYLTDMVYSAISIFKGKLSFSEFIKSYKGKVVHAVFDIRDIKPALMYFLFLFKFLKNR
ncbi:MAG: hypothetical protein JXL81_14645, partial [Deltaproteobacteria bacterium]|nr:hypothetical protein [Deltaproteobacteria bacterium]